MLPHIGKIFLTGFSANIFRYRDVKIRSCVQVFQTSYSTIYVMYGLSFLLRHSLFVSCWVLHVQRFRYVCCQSVRQLIKLWVFYDMCCLFSLLFYFTLFLVQIFCYFDLLYTYMYFLVALYIIIKYNIRIILTQKLFF